MHLRLILAALLAILSPIRSFSADQTTTIDSLAMFHAITAENSGKIPQEMIYLHLDNTSYYRGDRIYFACYLVTAAKLQPSNLSQTVYVELLNPSGKIIDRCVLKAEDGRCHGSLLVDETPFYSGYYEIRAYTRYMLNFGPEAIFSRVIPVYNTPKVEGDWADRTMLPYGSAKRNFSRPKPIKAEKVNAKFYPEGGHLVRGLSTNVGLEITDDTRRPLQATGQIIDQSNDSVVAAFTTGHMGRCSFSFVPNSRKYRANIIVDGRKHHIDLPVIENEGISLTVDNISNPDSINISISRTDRFPTVVVGASVTCRGVLYNRAIFDLSENKTASYIIPHSKLPTGVIQLTLFDSEGNVVADRLFFNNRNDLVKVEYKFDKESYAPYEQINLDVKLSHSVPFSISVTESDNHVEYGANIMSELLLSSELKGYIHNPAYYLGDPVALDQLLMIQGWRRYDWRHLAGIDSYNVENLPEQGIEVHGQVIGQFKNSPQSGVTISALITGLSDSIKDKPLFLDTFQTDAQGEFAFRTDIDGKCMLTLSPAKKGKIKPFRILLNPDTHPALRQYDMAELVDNIEQMQSVTMDTLSNDSIEEIINLYNERVHNLKEIEVIGTASNRVQEKSEAAESFDIAESLEQLINTGAYIPRSLPEMLAALDNHFTYSGQILYRNRTPIFIVEGELGTIGRKQNALIGNYDPFDLPLESINQVYINTKKDVIRRYIAELFPAPCAGESISELHNLLERLCGAVVFIEPNSVLCGPMKKGMRRAILNGYSNTPEFYSPDYSNSTPLDGDTRRTLYWSPQIETMSDGPTTISFYNNGHINTGLKVEIGVLPSPIK